MSLELEIGELQLAFDGAAGHEHRAGAISRRSIAILEELVNQNLMQLGLAGGGRRLAQVTVPSVKADLNLASNEQLARMVAQAIYGALIEQLKA
jgi:hypothetical protein